MKKRVNFYNMFWLFIFASILGWIIEVIWSFYKRGYFINHSSVVIGPFNMTYGICACFLTGILYKLKDKSIFTLFITGFIGGSIIEYCLSLFMQLVLGFTAWDYSKYFLNINGRICLKYSIFWGILSVFWIKFIFPYIQKLIAKINNKYNKIIVISFTIFLLLDLMLTMSSVVRAREFDKHIPPQNKYEEFLDKKYNKEYLTNMFNNRWKD